MKTLHVLRHAKSSWEEPGLADHDRPLARRGERDVRRLAAHIERADLHPDLVLCSTARRTQETLAGVRQALAPLEVRDEPDLYGASTTDLIRILRRLPAGVGSVMVIAHNPGLEELVDALAGDGDEAALHQLRTKFPTGALATLDLDIEGWAELATQDGYLRSLVIPAALTDE